MFVVPVLTMCCGTSDSLFWRCIKSEWFPRWEIGLLGRSWLWFWVLGTGCGWGPEGQSCGAGLWAPRADPREQIPPQMFSVCAVHCVTAVHFPGWWWISNSFPRIVVLVNKAVLDARVGNGVGNPLRISARREFLILSNRKSSCRYCRALIAWT